MLPKLGHRALPSNAADLFTHRWNAAPLVVAPGRVGKTSLVVRYCKDTFNEQEQSTIQASHLTKRLTIGDCNVMLNVWVSRPRLVRAQVARASLSSRASPMMPSCPCPSPERHLDVNTGYGRPGAVSRARSHLLP